MVNHDWHTGLIVRGVGIPLGLVPETGDFPAANYLKLGWGDWDYYQSGDPGLWLTLKATLWLLGTDSAPHPKSAKEAACGCAGMYTAHAAIELYAEAFEEAGRLDKLEAFTSFYGADFYSLPRNRETITLVKETWVVPVSIAMGDEVLVPLRAGQTIGWKLV